MKTKYLIYTLLALAAIVAAAYMLNAFQTRLELAVGKFLTWLIVLLLTFGAGWLAGRFGGRRKSGQESVK